MITFQDKFGVTYSEDKKILIRANTKLTNYIIPEGTETIEEVAFYECTGLISIILPSTLISIKDNAFRKCTSLEDILLPDSLVEIYGNAFQECSSLRVLKIPQRSQIKGHLSFHGCDCLEFINIPKSVTEIHSRAFEFCRSLKYIQIHDGITKIKRDAFNFCESLCCITSKPFNIETLNFSNEEYHQLKYFITPPNLNAIEERAFYGCNKLRNIIITSPDISVGEHAFGSNYDYQKNIYIPLETYSVYKDSINTKNCRLIAYSFISSILNNDEDTTAVNALDFLYSQTAKDGSILSLDGARLLSAPKECKSYKIPNSVIYVCDGAFFRREKLKSVVIPISVRRLGNSAFGHCHELEKIILPPNLVSIGEWCFSCCYSLTSITLPNLIKTIPDRCFYCCKKLSTICIDRSITTIDSTAFKHCYNLKIIYVNLAKEEAKEMLQKAGMANHDIERVSFISTT